MSKVTYTTDTPVIINSELDYEWVILILEAKRMGLTLEEIKEFLLCK